MANITFGGISSGIDTNSIIDKLVSAARAPVSLLRNKRSDYQTQRSTISALVSRLGSLRSSAQAISTTNSFKASTATSSDTNKVGVVASSSASPGTYQLQVTGLAQAERSYSLTVPGKDQTGLLGAGTLTLQVGSADPVAIEVDGATDTLQSVADKLNASGAQVQAAIVSDGTSFRLLVMGQATGAANAITFTETAGLQGTLGLSRVDAERMAATDAAVVMDGLAFASPSNQFASVIPGVTLTAKERTPDTSTVTVTVANDQAAMAAKVADLVDNYNAVAKILRAQYVAGGTARTDTLIGDAAARNVQRRLQQSLTEAVGGLSGDYTALVQVGIKTQSDGTLAIDSTRLNAALTDDVDAVARLFTSTASADGSVSDGVAVRLALGIDGMVNPTNGSLKDRVSGIDRSVKLIDERIASVEKSLTRYEDQLRKQFAAMEQLMAGYQSQSSFLAQRLGGG
jgi:flagellar hook-associated protein 2